MPEKELLQRVTRIETKLDMVLPHIEQISDLKNDMKNVKRGVAFLGSVLSIIGIWAAKYFSHQ